MLEKSRRIKESDKFKYFDNYVLHIPNNQRSIVKTKNDQIFVCFLKRKYKH